MFSYGSIIRWIVPLRARTLTFEAIALRPSLQFAYSNRFSNTILCIIVLRNLAMEWEHIRAKILHLSLYLSISISLFLSLVTSFLLLQ